MRKKTAFLILATALLIILSNMFYCMYAFQQFMREMRESDMSFALFDDNYFADNLIASAQGKLILIAIVCLFTSVIAAIILSGYVNKPYKKIADQNNDLETLNEITRAQSDKIQLAHHRAKLMMDAVPICSMLWDKDGNIFDCNEESVRKFEVGSKQEFIDKFFEFSPEVQPNGIPSRMMAAKFIKEAFAEGRCVFEWMHQLLDGTQIPCEMTLVRVNSGDSDIVAAHAQDLRKHKNMLAETLRLHGELKAALKDANQANRAKSSFLASMSHEMRTPLNAVVGLSELILNTGNLHGETEERLEKIHTSGMALLGIVNDILDISKIESGKFEMHPIEYDTPSLINDIISLNIMRLADKPISFKLSVDERLPERIFGDDLRIKQIFNNLLTNAFKYTRKGSVKWSITFEVDGGSIWFISSVKDTGIGIKQEDMSKLFANYSQVDADINRKTEGTGLGLSITKRLVEMMDGTISVDSVYGEGSTFSVRIRQKYVSDAPIGIKTAENLMGTSFSSVRRSRGASLTRINMSYARVLVVDDVITNLDVIKGMLKPYGIKVDCAMNGLQAVEMVCAPGASYDAVFMDHMMPEMDGIEATRYIRDEIAAGRVKEMPIIALTANAIVGNEQIFLNNGFQAFISKPIDIMRLDSILKQWVRDKKREAGAVAVCTSAPAQGEKTPGTIFASCANIDRFSAGDGAIAGAIAGASDGTVGDSAASLVEELCAQGENGTADYSNASETFVYLAADEDIDVDAGLRRFGGNVDSYMEVLQSFLVNTRNIIGNMQRYLDSENMRSYAIAVHGVKGSCYGIGAMLAGNEGVELERLAKAGEIGQVRNRHGGFASYIDKLLATVACILKNYAASRNRPFADAPDAALLEALCEACGEYDINKVDDIMSQLDVYDYRDGGSIINWIREQVNELNFSVIAEGDWITGWGAYDEQRGRLAQPAGSAFTKAG